MSHEIQVSFGDCDPAGIVWYPRLLGWMDHTFHAELRQHGGHAAICSAVGAVGLGVVDVNASFRRPVRDGDLLLMDIQWEEWSPRSFRLCYVACMGEQPAFEGQETRAVFDIDKDGKIRAGHTDKLKSIIGG
ncbi:MAG: acyl-CoA thioesterase [Paracoccaceae bacterium]